MRSDSQSHPAPPAPDAHHPERRTRFVTACQHVLALGVVVAVLTPAATVVTLDVVPRSPGRSAAGAQGQFGAYARASTTPAEVPGAAVTPDVKEYQLTPPRGARSVPGGLAAKVTRARNGGQRVVSAPKPVLGDGTLGVTWGGGQQLDERAVTVQVRTRTDRWSEWRPLAYHAEHGPDPDSSEAKAARPGTEPIYVGDVKQVQVRVSTSRTAPDDLRLAVVDPGRAERTKSETPEIETGPEGVAGREGETEGAEPAPSPEPVESSEGSDGDLALQRATYTPRPKIFSRRQWGANESWRDRGSLTYAEVHAGFVHHTVNANGYTRSQVPSILRGIYAYHTRSRGWSDIGYNFLVDKFGRIWEGRAGGVARPVQGAHTLGYNDDAFAMSAIGNFETTRPRSAMKQAYGALMGWKLSLHGVAATDGRQWLDGRRFKAINGHRDADATACPGRYLYEKLRRIRRLSRDAQKGWSGRELETNLVPGPVPDLVVRRASDNAAMVLPIRRRDGKYRLGKPQPIGRRLGGAQKLMHAGDWDRNGENDIMFRRKRDNALMLIRQRQDGTWADPLKLRDNFHGKLLNVVGDWNGDGWPDVVMQPRNGRFLLFPGKGNKGVRKARVMRGPVDGGSTIAYGRWNNDGAPEVITRKARELTLQLGNGPGGVVRTRTMGQRVGRYDWVIGIGDSGLTSGTGDVLVRRRTDSRVFILPVGPRGFKSRVRVGKSWRAKRFDLAG